ncbi:MAG: sulfurtransferase [Bacteroidetes bacterium]|nr:sulfurtransferase [Bacteroidota bacterium]
MSVLISPEQLSQEISSVLLFDCRFDLAQPADGRRRFDEGHIPGANYVSLDDDLTAPLAEHGGRHPLPTVEDMQALFGRLGIERGKTAVVAYDDEGGCYAARLWWMLRYCGQENVRVLDGGFTAWKDMGGEVSGESAAPVPVLFTAEVQSEMLASMEDVRDRTASEILFDCRASERFTGEEETIDVKAGHIPGAINVPWRDLVAENGHFVSIARMADALAVADERSIVYCGSGVTACVNVLAAARAGLDIPRLYAGSWSDWISYEENPIVTGS